MFRTENEALQYNAGMIRTRDFKNCVHLSVVGVSNRISKPWEPYCKKVSFDYLDRNPSNYSGVLKAASSLRIRRP